MGVDARIVVRVPTRPDNEQIRRWAFALGEAVGPEHFMVDDDDDIARSRGNGQPLRRSLNLYVPNVGDEGDYHLCGIEPEDGYSYLWVSLWGRYYGRSYERGNLWVYIAVAEWLERNVPEALVYYGGDSSETITPFEKEARRSLIAYWACKGGQPYHGGHWMRDPNPLQPTCELCGERAAQFGSGGGFGSWTCLGCGRHWVWVTGYDKPKAFKARNFDSFAAAKEMREALQADAAVDPVEARSADRVTTG